MWFALSGPLRSSKTAGCTSTHMLIAAADSVRVTQGQNWQESCGSACLANTVGWVVGTLAATPAQTNCSSKAGLSRDMHPAALQPCSTPICTLGGHQRRMGTQLHCKLFADWCAYTRRLVERRTLGTHTRPSQKFSSRSMQAALARLLQVGHLMQVSADATLSMQRPLRDCCPDTACDLTSGRNCLHEKGDSVCCLTTHHHTFHLHEHCLVNALTETTVAADLSTITAAAPERGRVIGIEPGRRDRLAVPSVPGLLIRLSTARQEEAQRYLTDTLF